MRILRKMAETASGSDSSTCAASVALPGVNLDDQDSVAASEVNLGAARVDPGSESVEACLRQVADATLVGRIEKVRIEPAAEILAHSSELCRGRHQA